MKTSTLHHRQILTRNIAALLAATGFFSPSDSSAANGSWIPTAAGPFDWGLAANWTGGTVAGGTAGDVATFGSVLTAAQVVHVDGTRVLGRLDFTGTAAFGTNILGNTGGFLVMDNGAGIAAINFTGSATPSVIGAPIALISNLEISATLAGGNQISGNITGSGGITIDSDGIHTAATVSGVGDIVIRGFNTYSGGTTITEARLQAYNSRSMGTGLVTVTNGGGVYMPNGGYWRNDFTLTGNGWNETAGLLGALRVDANSVFTGTIQASGNARINAHGTMTSLFNGVIAGGGNLEFSQTNAALAATWIVNNTNTNTGTITVGRALGTGTSTFQIGNNNTSGALGSGDVILNAGGVLAFNRTDSISVGNNISGVGNLVQSGIGTTTLTNASVLHSGTTAVSGLNSRLIFNPGGAGGALTLNATPGVMTLSNHADVEFNVTSANYSGSINGAQGTFIIQSGAGTLTLSGATDNSSARAIVDNGTLVLAKTSAAAVHAIGSPFAQYGLILNGGITQLGGTGGDQIFDQSAVRITSGGSPTAFDLNGTTEVIGTLTGTGANSFVLNTSASAGTLNLGGQSPATGIFFYDNIAGGSTVLHAPSFGGIITDGSGPVAITKSNTGLQILSGANDYSGATTVTGGLLSITGSTLSTGAVSVNGGSLAGTGSVGNITLEAAANSSVRAGATGQDRDAIGTLSARSLTVNGGDLRLNFSAGSNDRVALTGAANFALASTVTPVFTAAPVAGNYAIVTSTGLTLTTTPTVVVPTNTRSTFVVAANGNNLELQITGSGQNHSWTGATSTAWDPTVPAATNWTSTDTLFQNLDSVTFGDVAGAGSVVIGAGGVTPSGITVNATANYAFTGGAIAGGTGINKSNTGTLTLSTANTFTGDVNITGGTLIAGNAAALGDVTGQTFVSGGGTLDLNGQNLGAEIISISGTGVGGLGAIVNSGAAQINATRFVRLTGDATVGGLNRWDIRDAAGGFLDLGGNTLTNIGTYLSLVGVNVTDGNLVASQGTLSIETSSIVRGTGTITVNGGATLQLWQTANGNVTRPITLNDGAIVTNSAQNGTVNSPITLGGNVTLIGTGGTMNLAGSLSETGGPRSVTKNEASTFAFGSNVDYTGTTTVNAGTLILGAAIAGTTGGVNTVNAPGAATLGNTTPPVQGGTTGNLNLGNGGYTTITNAPADVTINSGTYAINTRSNNTIASNVLFNYIAGTNQVTITGVEQETTTTLTGAIGNTTKFGNLNIQGGTTVLAPGSAMNLRFVEVNNTNGAGGQGSGANTGTLNITGGNHRVMALFTGNSANSSGIVNMSGGSLTFENNGDATLQSANNSGFAMFGQSGIRIGHFPNGNNAPNIFNLSGGVLDASKVTISVGWDGAGFLNVTGGTLKANTLAVDGSGATGSPIFNRMDVSGGAQIEIGSGGMPSQGTNGSTNVGDSTWTAVESGEWTRGMNLTGNTTFDTRLNRIGLTGRMVGPGDLTKVGTGVLHVAGANINTGALNANAGLLRIANVQAFGDGTVSVANGATLDINGQAAGANAVRPSSITIGGAGTAGSLGGLINSSGTTGGIGVDAGGTINIASNLTVFAVGRTELGTSGAGLNPIINGGASNLTKNGHGQLIWRGTAASSIADITVNGGHFYAEENDASLGFGGSVTVNTGGMLSAWSAGGTTNQNKSIVLNGGAVGADVTSSWFGGLSLTADSQLIRNSANAAVVNFEGPLDLGGFTLTRRDRGNAGLGASAVTFIANLSSGDGSLDVHAGNVNIGDSSVFDGTGSIIVRTDALVSIQSTATVTKGIQLLGGSVSDNTVGSRSLTVNSAGSGYLRATNAGATVSLGTLNLLGSAGTAAGAKTAGMMFGSGVGYTDSTTPSAAIGAITLTNNSLLANNPNFTVSSNPGLTAANDTTFATWDGTKVTGAAPTSGDINTAGASDLVMQVATPGAPIVANQTIGNLVTDATVTITGATLTLANGGVILREAAAAGWTGTGSITSGRSDGILGLTLANRFVGSNGLGGGDVGSFTVGNITDNVLSASPLGYTPVTLVLSGFGNSAGVTNQAYTGGTVINGSRLEPTTFNALGLGDVAVREGGSVLYNGNYGISNNISAKGLGINEGGGTFGALRLGGGAGSSVNTGNISLDSAITRIHGTNTGSIFGDVTGANSFQRTGGGTIIVRSALSYTGATQLGTDGAGAPMGTHTVFNLANGGVASSLGASSSAASNLIFQSGTLNYIGGGASTDRLFSVAPTRTTAASALTIANNGFGNLNFTNTGAIAMNNGAVDVTLTLTANNYTANTFTPTLANPAGARLNISVNGPGSWELNGSSYDIAGTVAVSGGADLILNTAADLTIPVLTGASNRSYLVKNGSNTLTLGGAGLLAEADNGSGQLMVNAGTVIFDKRGSNGYANGTIVGASGAGRISALGSSGTSSGPGLLINGGTVRYASTANLDQIFDAVDVTINGGTLDLNGRADAFDSLNGAGGVITNGAAGTVSQIGVGASTSLPSELNFRAFASYGGVIQDGAGQMEVIKLGNGVQELTGANTYTGKTAIINGFLRIDSEDRLGPAPSSFVVNQLTFSGLNNTSGGGLEIPAGVSVTINDANRGVWLNAPAGDANSMRPEAGANLTFATPLRGNGGLQMVGAGTLTLAGANLYTNQTAVYRGTLALDYSVENNSKLADGAALIIRGGDIVLSGGSHTEVVSATTIDGGGQNAGSTSISRSGGTSRINLNAISRTNATAGVLNIVGSTVDVDANGVATTDTTNLNGIHAAAAVAGGSGIAYFTVGKTNWAFNSTNAADGAINGLATYQANNFGTATNHVDVSGAQAIAANSAISTLRFNDAGATSIGGAFILSVNQQGILMTPNAGATSIDVTTLRGFAAPTVAVTSDLVIHQHSTNDLTISSVIANGVGAFTNTTALTKAGAGKLILTGANTATGLTFINEGTLELQGVGVLGANVAANAVWVDGTFSLNRAGAYTIANNMGGGADGIILKKDNGATATLSGGIGTYSGGAVISQGTLVTTGDAFATSNQINDNPANATVFGTITLGDANTGATANVAYFEGRGANHTVRKDLIVTNTGSSGSAIIGAGTSTATKGVFNTVHQGSVQLNRATTFRGDSGDRLTFQGAISGNVGTLTIDAPNIAGVVINTNPGRVTIENDNTFVGDVVVNGAILQVGSGTIADPRNQIPDASNVTLNGVSAAKQAGLTLNGDSETINNLNGDVNTFIQSAASSSATMMRLTVNGTGTFDGVFHGGNNTGMTLEKAGSGTFTLGGTADNNSGRVLVSGGTLQLAKASSGVVHAAAVEATITGGTLLLGGTGGDQIWDNTPLTMYGGTFDFGGTNESVQNIFSADGVGTITNSGGTASTLTLGTNNGSTLFGGTIQNGASALALTKTGAGAVVLTGANTHTGDTTVTGGYVQIGNGGTTGDLGSGAVLLAANTQLVINRSNAALVGNGISGAGSVVMNGSGVATLSATNAYTGSTVVNAGTLLVTGSISGSAVTVNSGGTLGGTGTTGAIGVGDGGILAPGAGIGTLTSTGMVNFLDNSTYGIEINGINTDRVVAVSGLLSGLVKLTIDLQTAPVTGNTYTIFDGTSLFLGYSAGGRFAYSGNSLDEGEQFTATSGLFQQDFLISYNADGGNDVVLTAVIPEPGSAALLLGGLGALLGLRRRKTV